MNAQNLLDYLTQLRMNGENLEATNIDVVDAEGQEFEIETLSHYSDSQVSTFFVEIK